MDRTRIWLMGWGLTMAASGLGPTGAQEPAKGLSQLADRLNLTDRNVGTWLERLGAAGEGRTGERLLVLGPSGEAVAERNGGESSVVIDPELDRLLLDPGQPVVLVHNHPASVGLSAADIGQIAKPGVTAILAIGHDGSMFLAAAGPAMSRDFLEDRQYAQALREVKARLRTSAPSARVSSAERDAHLNHLVTRALAEARVIQYWFALRGASRESYQRARSVFNQVVAGAAAQLKNTRAATGRAASPHA